MQRPFLKSNSVDISGNVNSWWVWRWVPSFMMSDQQERTMKVASFSASPTLTSRAH
jgi:hypothetical protein